MFQKFLANTALLLILSLLLFITTFLLEKLYGINIYFMLMNILAGTFAVLGFISVVHPENNKKIK
jgi:hypothetical protein